MYGAFVWARRALKRQKRRFPARAAREAARREEAPPGAGLGWTLPPEGSAEARRKAAEAAAERAVEELEAAKAAEAAARVAEARKKEADRRALSARCARAPGNERCFLAPWAEVPFGRWRVELNAQYGPGSNR